MRQRILHIITDLNTGGAEIMLLRLLAMTDRSRFESRVLSLRSMGTLGSQIRDLGVEVDNLGFTSSPSHPWQLVRVLQAAREWRADVVQTWMYHANLAAIPVKLWGTSKLCWSIHSCDVNFAQYSRGWTAKFRLTSMASWIPDAIVVVSHASQRWHEERGYKPRRWAYIPIGIDTRTFTSDHDTRERLRNDLGFKPDERVIGNVARYHPMKDHANFLRAFAVVRKEMPQARAVLVGKGISADNTSLAALAQELGVSPYVTFLGERRDVPQLMNSFDLYCLSSVSGESCPTVLGEAMACGVPCAVTEVGDSKYIIGDTGLSVPTKQPVALGEACLKLLRLQGAERAAISVRARERVEKMFALEQVVPQYENLYTSLAQLPPERKGFAPGGIPTRETL